MKRPDGQTSIWTLTGVFVRRSRSTFCHVSWSVFEGVTKCQNWLGARSSGAVFSFPATSGQLASGTMPSEARNGQKRGMCDAVAFTQPSEWMRSLSTAFVPT